MHFSENESLDYPGRNIRSNNGKENRSKKITSKKADSRDPAGSDSRLGRTARALWRRIFENAGAPGIMRIEEY
jgi:hypothetical protein